MKRWVTLSPDLPRVCRLGFATRGDTHPSPEDLGHALARGINYWNWCGHNDGMAAAVRSLGRQRSLVVLAAQLSASSGSRDVMHREIERSLAMLGTDRIDVATLYYVQAASEWRAIAGAGGALSALREAQEGGRVGLIGLTTHRRGLAAQWIKSGFLDLLMIRYNAAHRGAADEVFPVARRRSIPVVAFTCLRWGALLEPTQDDPRGFEVPRAKEWYRYVLSHPEVGVALMAPDDREELDHNLEILDDWRAVSPEDRLALEAHGDRVRARAGSFP